MSALAAEFHVLRRAGRALLPRAPVQPDTPPPPSSIQPAHLLWLARRERALLWLHATPHPSALPSALRPQLDELAHCARLQALVRTGEICALHERFATAGVPLFVADDWMFGQCFHPEQLLAETTDGIRALVPASQLDRARELLAASGHAEANQSFLVATQGRAPVELLAADEPIPETTSLAIGSRRLHRLSDRAWLKLLAPEAAKRPALDLHRAWQVVFLAQRLAATTALALDEREQAGLARSESALGFSSAGRIAPASTRAATPAVLPISPFVPTALNVVERMLALAEVGPADLVCDLGCGDGRVPILAAARHGARGRGVDRDAALIATARAAATAQGVGDRVEFICADLFSTALHDTSVVSLYLLPAVQEPVRKRLLPQLPRGARIVSHDYFFPEWPPEKSELVRNGPARMAQIYLWRMA